MLSVDDPIWRLYILFHNWNQTASDHLKSGDSLNTNLMKNKKYV